MGAFDQFVASPFQALNSSKKNKLKYLSDDAKIFFQKGIKLFQSCYSLSDEQYPSWQELQKKSQELKRIANEHNDLSRLKQLTLLMKNKLRYEKSLQWYSYWNKKLQEETTWNTFRQKADGNPEKLRIIENLQQRWSHHAELSHYTSRALLFAADILDELEFHLYCAWKEYEKYKKQIFIDGKEYGVYLQLFLQEVHRQKGIVCEAMYARWRLALESQDMTYDDVTVNLVENLNQLGVTQDNTWFKRQRSPQTQDHNERLFIRFHQYIARHGNSEQNTLAQESLRISQRKEQAQGGNKKSLVLVDTSENAFFVPNVLQRLTPISIKRPRFLFKGHNFRHEFFQDKQSLLLKFVQFSELQPHVSSYMNLTDDPYWILLHSTYEAIVSQLEWVESQIPRGFFARYKQTSNLYLEEWRNLLLQQQKQIILHQICFLEQFVSHPPFLEHSFEEPVFKESEVQEIQSLFNNVRNNFINAGFQNNDRLEVLANQLTGLFKKDNDYRIQKDKILAIKAGLKQLKEGKPIEDSQFTLILHYYYEVSISKIADISIDDLSVIRTIGQSLIDFLSNQPDNLKSLKSDPFITWVEQCGKLIVQYHDNKTLEAIERSIEEFIKRYQSFLIDPHSDLKEKNNLCIRLENLVEKIAPVKYAVQISNLKTAREWLLTGKSLHSRATLETLKMLFRSTLPLENDNLTTSEEEVVKKNLELEQRLKESKALREEVTAMLEKRASEDLREKENLQAEYENTETDEASNSTSNLSPVPSIVTSTPTLPPHLLALSRNSIMESLREWDARQQQLGHQNMPTHLSPSPMPRR